MRNKHHDRQQVEIICDFCDNCQWITPVNGSLDLLVIPMGWLMVCKENAPIVIQVKYLDFCSIDCINKMDFNYA